MKLSQLKYLIISDLYRYTHKKTLKSFLITYIKRRGFKITFYYRICNYLYNSNSKILLYIFKIILLNCQDKYNIDIFPKTEIGPGFHISHGFGIVIHSSVKMGKNIDIAQGVTIGLQARGKKKGIPVIGNNVFIGPNATILGGITIGDNVAIGANSVILNDIPDNAVVAGVPGEIISYNGSEGYIVNTEYE